MRGAISRPWRNRLVIAASIGVVGFLFARLLRFDPQPVPYAVAMTVVLSLVWLLVDVVDGEPTHWTPTLPTTGDRVDEATSDLRVLSSHQQATEPSDALSDRLVALARGRDPALADELRTELSGSRRITPAEIDRILTRIEESHDRR
ncbi:hypothetical protein SAMN04489844_2784 [Nocardioides exalbidus]|uniref:Uncharacterized protein n=1 Tax=Nocardioides exalbidus TaxID=402596 RepID=A0A1H4UJF1_9ACTN|nr:hypothetical protein [Nocardioides exalbidus]SEC68815.1 hypothetical protein SAMN04489844_2784 [Nocardioides exalbidus]